MGGPTYGVKNGQHDQTLNLGGIYPWRKAIIDHKESTTDPLRRNHVIVTELSGFYRITSFHLRYHSKHAFRVATLGAAISVFEMHHNCWKSAGYHTRQEADVAHRYPGSLLYLYHITSLFLAFQQIRSSLLAAILKQYRQLPWTLQDVE